MVGRLISIGCMGGFITFVMVWLSAVGTVDETWTSVAVAAIMGIAVIAGAMLPTNNPAVWLGAIGMMLAMTGGGAVIGYVGGKATVERNDQMIAEANPFGNIQGWATAVTGTELDINGTRVHLAGIEERGVDAVCRNENGESWPCGAVALARLTALTAGRRTHCRFHDDAEPKVGACTANNIDLGAQLIREGLVQPATNK